MPASRSLQRKRGGGGDRRDGDADLARLDDEELALVKLAAQFPRIVEQAAATREPHRIAFYLYDLAAAFHALWNRGNDRSGPSLLGSGRSRNDTRRGFPSPTGWGRSSATASSIMGVAAAEEM